MSGYKVVLLPGDGIGLEVAACARKLLQTVQDSGVASFDVQEIPCGGKFYLDHGQTGSRCARYFFQFWQFLSNLFYLISHKLFYTLRA